MNDRMQEIIKETGLYIAYENSAVTTKELEYFVEQIIKECMNCSTWVGEVNKNPVEPIHTARAINKRIKNHFGV